MTIACAVCDKPALEEFPHRHETPARPDYDPMPPRPATLPELLALLRREYRAELPDRLHAHQVPDHTEPIPVSLADPDGPQVAVTDSGPLGGPAFSPAFHRLIGATRFMEDEMVQSDDDLRPFPWTRQLEGVRRWCTGKHRTWYEHQDRPLCWLLLKDVVLGGYSMGNAADLEGVSLPKTVELVERAAGKWFSWVSNDLNGIELRAARRHTA